MHLKKKKKHVYAFHNRINKPFSGKNMVSRMLFEVGKLARSAKKVIVNFIVNQCEILLSFKVSMYNKFIQSFSQSAPLMRGTNMTLSSSNLILI